MTLVSYSRMAAVLSRPPSASRRRGRLGRGGRPALPPTARLRDARRVGKKTNRAIVVEEGWPSYGISAEVAARIQEARFDYLDAPVRRVAAAEVPLPYAKPLELAALPDATALVKVIHETLDATRFRG